MWGAEAEEEKEEGADTELKTKTPHVNVGNNTNEQDNRKDAWASIKEAEGRCGAEGDGVIYPSARINLIIIVRDGV